MASKFANNKILQFFKTNRMFRAWKRDCVMARNRNQAKKELQKLM